MKKYLIMAVVIAGLLVTGLVVYAETEEVEVPEWYTDMMTWRRGEIDQALEDGSITEEEAQAWLEHVDEMEAFHLEEGFDGNGTCPRDDKDLTSGRGFGGGCRRGGLGSLLDINR